MVTKHSERKTMMKKKTKQNHDLKNWLKRTLLVGAVPLAVFAANRLFAKPHKPRLETRVQAVQPAEVNDVNNLRYSIPGSNKPDKPYEPNKPTEPNYADANEPNVSEPNVADVNGLEAVAEPNYADANEPNAPAEPNYANVPFTPYIPQYTPKDIDLFQKILFAEAANQSPKARRLIVRLACNLVKKNEKFRTLGDVLKKDIFTSIGDKANKNWQKAIGKLKMTCCDKKAYAQCREDIEFVLSGGFMGFDYEEFLINYHDTSITKPKSWKSAREVLRADDLVFYVHKKDF